ncbi:MAG: hypothetical protein KBG28_07990 [Kofleriaceae bacterium]|nr:hypothetical protein [Kofleriaceae bacterium]MBP6835886.1 hypothetical protein [Kofleriaceae bacterium]MBP9203885.1 hypothetical protein [Kofleriaceae bacterium]
MTEDPPPPPLALGKGAASVAEPEPEPAGAAVDAAVAPPTDPAAAPGAGEATPARADDPSQPLVPATLEATPAALRAAAGLAPTPPRRRRRTDPGLAAASEPDDERDPDLAEPRSRKPMVVLGAILAVGATVAVLVLLGRANADRLALRCGATAIHAERGRVFPPWGTIPLGGAEWAPIGIPPAAECISRRTDSVAELTGWYLDALLAEVDRRLTAREVTELDAIAALLDQALLLARDPGRRDQRRDIERLVGDVAYWRAVTAARAASAQLGEVRKQFDAAAARRPRHASDAAAWGELLGDVAARLSRGPSGVIDEPPFAPGPSAAPAPRVDAQPGVALPAPPEVGADAEPGPASAAPPDAGLPAGGVLL